MLHVPGMVDSTSGQRFEQLVGRIFKRHEFRVLDNQFIVKATQPQRLEVDLILIWDDVRTVVEVKTLRTRTPSFRDLRRAADLLSHAKAALPADHAVLVINLRRDQLAALLAVPSDIMVLGLEDLIHLAGDDVYLLSQIEAMDRELNSALGEFDRKSNLAPAAQPADISSLYHRSSAARRPPPSVRLTGNGLCEELREISPGKTVQQKLASGRKGVNWRLFEQVGYESLVYVFEGLFGNWKEQQSVAGEQNRFDALAKVQGDDAFCRTLIEDFRTRYILFEFKNYTEEIKPNLIHITEKYLFPAALRSTAIIISPCGLTDTACEATKGALRDARKLILSMDVEMLCKLLHDKDHGISPILRMEEQLDGFLQSLGR